MGIGIGRKINGRDGEGRRGKGRGRTRPFFSGEIDAPVSTSECT